jgi:hypothetical protein
VATIYRTMDVVTSVRVEIAGQASWTPWVSSGTGGKTYEAGYWIFQMNFPSSGTVEVGLRAPAPQSVDRNSVHATDDFGDSELRTMDVAPVEQPTPTRTPTPIPSATPQNVDITVTTGGVATVIDSPGCLNYNGGIRNFENSVVSGYWVSNGFDPATGWVTLVSNGIGNYHLVEWQALHICGGSTVDEALSELGKIDPGGVGNPRRIVNPTLIYNLVQNQSTPNLWGVIFTANDSAGARVTVLAYRDFQVHGWAVAIAAPSGVNCVCVPGGPVWQVDNRVTCTSDSVTPGAYLPILIRR